MKSSGWVTLSLSDHYFEIVIEWTNILFLYNSDIIRQLISARRNVPDLFSADQEPQ